MWEGNDPVLLPYLNAPKSEYEEAELLEALVNDHIVPAAKKMLSGARGSDDLLANTVLAVLKRVDNIKALCAEPIVNLHAYIGGITSHLKSRHTHQSPPDLPLDADTLDALEAAGKCFTPEPSLDLVMQEEILRLWSEICALPRNQIVALIFNARSPAGDAAVEILTGTGLASPEEIAQLIDIPLPEVKAMIKACPMSNKAIGAKLGLEEQQVINLRSAARKRLERTFMADMQL